jgi:hypothetical protein
MRSKAGLVIAAIAALLVFSVSTFAHYGTVAYEKDPSPRPRESTKVAALLAIPCAIRRVYTDGQHAQLSTSPVIVSKLRE